MYNCPSCHEEMMIPDNFSPEIHHCFNCKITYCQSLTANTGSLFVNDLIPLRHTVDSIFEGTYEECCKAFKLKAFT